MTLGQVRSDFKVCAVIVTYNRKFLLSRCLKSILSQTIKVKKVIVVDNHSTDGSEFLVAESLLPIFRRNCIDLEWIRLEKNLGGAGGFNVGFKSFILTDEDYLWVMDDDGYPREDCLELLIKDASPTCCIGPLVISDKDKSLLTFPIRKENSIKNYNSLADIPTNITKIYNKLTPFNGTLIGKSLVKTIGGPNPNYFIWGDEIDFMERAKAAGATIFTNCAAIFFHPKTQNLGSPMFFNLMRFNDPDSFLKLYCYCRNNFVNKRKYKGIFFAFLFAIKAIWFYAFTKPSHKKLTLVIKAIFHGFKNDFSKHSNYM